MSPTVTPSSDVDIVADDILADPYPVYAALRELGQVVYLERYGCWAFPRYEQVRTALRDHERFSSRHSVGYEPSLNAALRQGGVLITAAGQGLARIEAHTVLSALLDQIGKHPGGRPAATAPEQPRVRGSESLPVTVIPRRA